MRIISAFMFLMPISIVIGQSVSCGDATSFSILHFTKTNGFNHNTRGVSADMFEEIGMEENFTITDTQDESIFDDLDALLDYEVIIFSNTSGNNLLDSTQQAHVEEYISQGGAFLGIHAATDTYRNRSWPFYNDLVGGIVQSNPNHTSNNYPGTMDVIGNHSSTENIPDPWDKREEYYYWERNGGWLSPDIVTTIEVRQTGDSTYDARRPISWYVEFDSGARSYYTALGHAQQNFSDSINFKNFMRDALCWCVEAEALVLPVELLNFQVDKYNCHSGILSWQIGSALNFSHFVLERSSDGIDFITLKDHIKLSELNNRSITVQDQYVESGSYFYRLKMVDQDGNSSFSKIISVSADCSEDAFDIYPNPVMSGEELTISSRSSIDPSEHIAVRDFSGRLYRIPKHFLYRSGDKMIMNTTGLPSGQYVLSVGSSAKTKTFIVSSK